MLLRRSERALAFAAAAMLLGIMLIGTVDVALRYLFNAPLGWSYDLITLYLMTGVFYLALSDTLADDGHIAVDLLHGMLSPRKRHAFLVPGYGLSLLVLAAVCWLAARRTLDSYVGGDVVSGPVDWPTWVANLMITAGFVLMTARVAVRFVGHLLSAVSGSSVIGLPAVAGRDGR